MLVNRLRMEAEQARAQQSVANQAQRLASRSKTPLILLTEPNGATSRAPSPPRNKQASLHETLGRVQCSTCRQIVLICCDPSITGSTFPEPERDAIASLTTARAPAVSGFEQWTAIR